MATTKKENQIMPFLMTYGWAILVILAAFGALAYFGVIPWQQESIEHKCTTACEGIGKVYIGHIKSLNGSVQCECDIATIIINIFEVNKSG